MAALPGTPITVDEYLTADYSPDVDFVDGVIEDRNVGEKDHSKLQFRILKLLDGIGDLCIFPEVRIRVTSTRYRVPDVAVYLEEPDEQVFTMPPFLAIEILSPEDRMSRMLIKIGDYDAMGVPHIWVFDPVQKRAYKYVAGALQQVTELEAGDRIRLAACLIFE